MKRPTSPLSAVRVAAAEPEVANDAMEVVLEVALEMEGVAAVDTEVEADFLSVSGSPRRRCIILPIARMCGADCWT